MIEHHQIYWVPRKIIVENKNGTVFLEVGKSSLNKQEAYRWIYFHGSPDEAKNYGYTMTVSGETIESFTYHGYMHTLDDNWGKIIDEKSCLTIPIEAIKRIMDEETKVNVEVSIHFLKEDAKDEESESGVSDGSDD